MKIKIIKPFLERDLDEVLNGNLDDIISFLTSIRDKHQSSGITVSTEIDTGYNNGTIKFFKSQFIQQ